MVHKNSKINRERYMGEWIDWSFSGARITTAREARGRSVLELAKAIDVSTQQVEQWEQGDVKPGQASFVKICNALQTPPAFFFVQGGNFGNIGNGDGQK